MIYNSVNKPLTNDFKVSEFQLKFKYLIIHVSVLFTCCLMASPFFLAADLCLSIFLMILQILMESFQTEFMVWSGYQESGGSKAHLANWSMGIRIRNLIFYIELS